MNECGKASSLKIPEENTRLDIDVTSNTVFLLFAQIETNSTHTAPPEE